MKNEKKNIKIPVSIVCHTHGKVKTIKCSYEMSPNIRNMMIFMCEKFFLNLLIDILVLLLIYVCIIYVLYIEIIGR